MGCYYTYHAEMSARLAAVSKERDELRAAARKEETVVIYDELGNPNIMRRIPKITNRELFGGSDRAHRAFRIGGVEYDEIYLPVYDGSMIGDVLCSLPYQKPANCMTLEQMEEACWKKGEGWHLMTAAEWGLAADLSVMLGTLPNGNTDSGRYHADHEEKGICYDGYHTLTGSGPSAWTHNHQADGIHDLCGNNWKRLRGLRLHKGRIQTAADNDAALPIDLSANGTAWVDLLSEEGRPLFIGPEDGVIGIGTTEPSKAWDGCRWKDAIFHAGITEEMRELALFDGEPNAWLYTDSEEEDMCAYRGGYWSNGAFAGVFFLNFSLSRSYAGGSIGGRPAYFKKKTDN